MSQRKRSWKEREAVPKGLSDPGLPPRARYVLLGFSELLGETGGVKPDVVVEK